MAFVCSETLIPSILYRGVTSAAGVAAAAVVARSAKQKNELAILGWCRGDCDAPLLLALE